MRKVKNQEIQCERKKMLVTVRVVKHWHRLPSGAVESPSPEMFKTGQDTDLGNQLQAALFERGVGRDDPKRSLPTSAILRPQHAE